MLQREYGRLVIFSPRLDFIFVVHYCTCGYRYKWIWSCFTLQSMWLWL